MIYGVKALDWWFVHISVVFLVFSLVLMILLGKGESKATEIFINRASYLVGFTLIVELARGINKTLEDGKISDTILNF